MILCLDYRTHQQNANKNLNGNEKFTSFLFDSPTEVISYARISSSCKDEARLLQQQHDYIESVMSTYECKISGTYSDIVKGWKIRRTDLRKAVKVARSKNIPIVVQDIDRLLRSKKFHPKLNTKIKPTKREIEKFLDYYQDVVFIVIDSQEDIKKNKTKRGQANTERKIGKPRKEGYRKRRKERVLPKVRRMREQGYSLRQISIATKLSLRTVWMWCRG